MAKPTSASDRSKRKSSQPVTKGQNPQRANRQRVSNAQVTNDGGRGNRGARVTNAGQRTNTGSARVTGTTPKALPPGKPGGQLATKPTSPNQRRLQAQAKLDQAAKGSSGPNRVGQPPGAANRQYGANVVNAAVKRAQSSTRLGRNISVGRGGAAATALGLLNAVDDARLSPSQRAQKYSTVNPERGQNLLTKLQSGTLGQPNTPKPKQGNAQSRFAGAREANLNRINNDPRFAAPQKNNQPRNFRDEQQTSQGQPKRRGSGSMPSAVTRSMSGGGTSGSGSRGGSSAAKPAMPGRKWEDFNPGRGTSKSNNPLLDRDKGGFKLRDRMKNREATDQANKAKSMDSNFGQDSGYQPKTKVDGSKYAGKKPDMKKVNEYDRRKRRYYD